MTKELQRLLGNVQIKLNASYVLTFYSKPRIYGQWQDVPLGETRGNGNLGLLIDPTGTKITKFWSLGDYFGGSEWTRANDCSRISSGTIVGSDSGRP